MIHLISIFDIQKYIYIFFSNNLLLTFRAPLGLGVPFHLGFFFVLLSVRGKTTQSLASISHPASSSENDICRSPQTVLSQCYWLFSVTHMQGLVPGWWSRRFLEGFCNLEISAFASLPRLWCCTVAPRDLGTGVFFLKILKMWAIFCDALHPSSRAASYVK